MPTHKFSDTARAILDRLERGSGHLFITGKAGTGKSTLLQHFRLHTKTALVVLAPTGVAAVHIGGETIHSFFRFAPNVTQQEAKSDAYFCDDRTLYHQLEMIIIDEISMVRSDLLDCVDTFLQIVRDDPRPFGGVRVIFFGDLYQLPPVVTSSERETFRTRYPSEWFFDSQVIQTLLQAGDEQFAVMELDTVYRQRDQSFVQLLEAIRLHQLTPTHLTRLNVQVGPSDAAQDGAITLTSRRDTAAQINESHLAALPGQEQQYTGHLTGAFPDGHLPTSALLTLKVGARVMFVANDPDGRYVNGTLGTIKQLGTQSVRVAIDGAGVEEITPHTWELSHTVLSKKQELEKEKIGEFTQLPLMLAWAVTIHKAQGKTFDRIVIDLGSGAFAHGQVYVALSRARTLSGITLTHPVRETDVKLHWKIGEFFTTLRLRSADREQSREEKYQRIQDAIEMGTALMIQYLTKDGTETSQELRPLAIAPMQYQGRPYVGVRSKSLADDTEITLNAARILHVS